MMIALAIRSCDTPETYRSRRANQRPQRGPRRKLRRHDRRCLLKPRPARTPRTQHRPVVAQAYETIHLSKLAWTTAYARSPSKIARILVQLYSGNSTVLTAAQGQPRYVTQACVGSNVYHWECQGEVESTNLEQLQDLRHVTPHHHVEGNIA